MQRKKLNSYPLEFTEKMRIEAIRECVNRCEKEAPESTYNECLERVKQTDLRNVVDLKSMIRRFLYNWGRMGRVLGQDRFKNWENRLVAKIESNRKELEDLRLKDLSLINLDEFGSVIKRNYALFSDMVGPIAAAKTLHLICPNFFPLWDNAIAAAFRKECKDRKNGKFSASDYLRFMKNVKDFANRYEQVLDELVNQYKKGKLSILDDFFWWMTQRPMSIFMP